MSPTISLPYKGMCQLKLTINLHGNEIEVEGVLVDTGFTTNTGFGLKLPTLYSKYAKYAGVGQVKVGDGRIANGASIHDGKIVKIEGYEMRNTNPIPVLFLDGMPCLGVMFLQQYVLHFDGPEQKADIHL